MLSLSNASSWSRSFHRHPSPCRPNGSIVVGVDALEEAYLFPQSTFYDAKRLIGKLFAEPSEFDVEAARYQFRVCHCASSNSPTTCLHLHLHADVDCYVIYWSISHSVECDYVSAVVLLCAPRLHVFCVCARAAGSRRERECQLSAARGPVPRSARHAVVPAAPPVPVVVRAEFHSRRIYRARAWGHLGPRATAPQTLRRTFPQSMHNSTLIY